MTRCPGRGCGRTKPDGRIACDRCYDKLPRLLKTQVAATTDDTMAITQATSYLAQALTYLSTNDCSPATTYDPSPSYDGGSYGGDCSGGAW